MHQYSDGQYNEAEVSFMEVGEEKKVLGAKHSDMLTNMANLASTYRNQGRLKEGGKLELQTVETRKSCLTRSIQTR